LKCVLLGDGAVGKTSLVVSYSTNGYPTEYVPTAFDNYSVRIQIDGTALRLQISDTAGQDEFDGMRPLCYPGTDVVLVCFSVVRPTSLCNIRDKWLPEIKKYLPKVPVVLVGTQTDLRTSLDVLVDLARYSERPITEEEAAAFAKQHGACGYVECSALTQKNLKQVFDTAILEGMEFAERKQRKNSRKSRNDYQAGKRTLKCKPRAWWRKYCCAV
uniref:Small monomeric GTPase n=1 Tax=Ciona savignyi TaxID=51511 RepID=H2YR36_CIOSA